jgi:hypothetical protein
VKHLDRVFSACTAGIDAETYKLIANGCIMLAAKFDELDMNIPMVVDMQVANKFKVGYEMLKAIEGELLMILDFDLMCLTPYTILNQLFASGIVWSSDNKSNGKDITERTLLKLKEYSYFFCDCAAEYYVLSQKFLPSQVATACVYLARKCCNLDNVWDLNLQEYTTYNECQLADVIKAFYSEMGELIQYSRCKFKDQH